MPTTDSDHQTLRRVKEGFYPESQKVPTLYFGLLDSGTIGLSGFSALT